MGGVVVGGWWGDGEGGGGWLTDRVWVYLGRRILVQTVGWLLLVLNNRNR